MSEALSKLLLLGCCVLVGTLMGIGTYRLVRNHSPVVVATDYAGDVRVKFRNKYRTSPFLFTTNSGITRGAGCPSGQHFSKTEIFEEGEIWECVANPNLPDGSRRFGGS